LNNNIIGNNKNNNDDENDNDNGNEENESENDNDNDNEDENGNGNENPSTTKNNPTASPNGTTPPTDSSTLDPIEEVASKTLPSQHGPPADPTIPRLTNRPTEEASQPRSPKKKQRKSLRLISIRSFTTIQTFRKTQL
jgi:hypothetical protein